MANDFFSRRAPALLVVILLVPAAAFACQAGSIGTNKIFEALAVREGATICEIGAGDGELTLAAAKIVGAEGRVFASELGDARVKTLRDKVAAAAAAPITVVPGDAAKTNFPDAGCDAVFMRNVYHHFGDPAAMNASIAAALKPGGRLAVIDLVPPPGNEAACPADRGKDGMHGITEPALSRELKEAGFEPISSEVGAQRWFMVVVSNPKR